jgi:iron complex transport system ATP-binding protein
MIISAENISCTYPGLKRNIIDGMSFTVNRGDFAALIGPNGAGKTTVFRVLSGYIRVTGGSIRIKDRNILELSHSERAGTMAVVPQNVFSPLSYTVRQIVEMGRVSRLSRFAAPSKKDIQAISYAMDVMDVNSYSETSFNNLSGGEKQRVMLAMALAQEPEILLLDEPTSHLDIGHSSQLMKILSELNGERKLTVLLISHDINIAARYASRVILMKSGKIMSDGDVRHVLEPDLIESAYDCKVKILDDLDGGRFIAPL